MKRTPIKPEDTETIKKLLNQIGANSQTINSLSIQSAELNKKIFEIASNGDNSLLGDCMINNDNTELITFKNKNDKLKYHFENLKNEIINGEHYELAVALKEFETSINQIKQ